MRSTGAQNGYYDDDFIQTRRSLLHFGEKAALVLHRYDDDDGLQIIFMTKEIFKYVHDEVDDAIFHPS